MNNQYERLFAELCKRNYLSGFVFHSPKFGDTLQYEAGDVVLWVRTQILVFEILWRDSSKTNSKSTKRFIKRVGEKRKQLENDFMIYSTQIEDIKMTNENNEIVEINNQFFHPRNFIGIIIIDCDMELEPINFLSYKQSLMSKFPIAILTKDEFLYLASEADTIPDLTYYLKDRYGFIKTVYENDYELFLNKNRNIEKDLIALYKMNEYQFPIGEWNSSINKRFWETYITEFAEAIKARDKENEESFIIDQLIDVLRNMNHKYNSSFLHASELAIFPRRARAGSLAIKTKDAFRRIKKKCTPRFYAIFNETTGCWLLFYFEHSGTREEFYSNVTKYSRLKLFYEMNHNNFRYSVFGYGFRKSTIETGDDFDDIFLCIEDAVNYNELAIKDLKEANQYFGHIQAKEIKEYPK